MSIKNYFAVCFLGVIAWLAYGIYEDKQAETAQIVQDHDLDDTQLAAYKACDGHMSGKQLDPQNPDIKRFNGSVPASICACQAKSMVKVMLPGKYSSHRRVVKSMTEGERATQVVLKETQVNADYSPSSGFAKLRRSLDGCIADYRKQEAARQRELIREICKSPDTRNTHLCRS